MSSLRIREWVRVMGFVLFGDALKLAKASPTSGPRVDISHILHKPKYFSCPRSYGALALDIINQGRSPELNNLGFTRVAPSKVDAPRTP